MKLLNFRLDNCKTAKNFSLLIVVFLIIFSALIDRLPASAEVADATATWQDAPVNALDSIIGSEQIINNVSGKASWYVHPHYRTILMAASTIYPKGSIVKVTNLANNKSVTVTIKDYGPDPIKHPERVIDLNKIAFQKIASTRAGIINVSVDVIFRATSTVAKK